MKLKTRLTWPDLRNHLQYQGWLYLLLIGLSFALVNLVYAQTAYRPPQDARIDIYIQGSGANTDTVNEFLKPIWDEAVPQTELVNAVLLLSGGGENDYYANMQLVTYMAAAEGDIYMLSTADFKRFASQGSFVPLDEQIAEGVINAEGLDLAAGRVTPVDINEKGEVVSLGESRQYGIPAGALYKFASDLMIDNRDMVLAVAVNSGNEEDSITFLDALIQATRGDIPDFFK